MKLKATVRAKRKNGASTVGVASSRHGTAARHWSGRICFGRSRPRLQQETSQGFR